MYLEHIIKPLGVPFCIKSFIVYQVLVWNEKKLFFGVCMLDISSKTPDTNRIYLKQNLSVFF